MKTKTYFMILLGVMAVLAISEGCSKDASEGAKSVKAPIFDGLYFNYDVTGYSGDSTTQGHQTYTVESAGSRTYKITMKNYTHMPNGSQILIMDRIFIVDENGIVKECKFRSYEGGYCPLWLPVSSLEVGEYLRDAGMKVFEKTTWKGWETYRISDKPDSINFYYELDQGFLVGTDGTGLRQDLTLIENNAGIPTSY